jgi:hypothetical protein
MGEIKQTPVVVPIAVYGGLTRGRPIPSQWDSLLSESQIDYQLKERIEGLNSKITLSGRKGARAIRKEKEWASDGRAIFWVSVSRKGTKTSADH